jgi:hypothetical protein
VYHHSTLATLTYVCWIVNWSINFENFILRNRRFLKSQYFHSKILFFWKNNNFSKNSTLLKHSVISMYQSCQGSIRVLENYLGTRPVLVSLVWYGHLKIPGWYFVLGQNFHTSLVLVPSNRFLLNFHTNLVLELDPKAGLWWVWVRYTLP